MYAIIETGGKQLRVAEGDVIRTDLIDQEVGATVTFDRVVLSSNGSAVSVGAPIVTGAVVLGTGNLVVTTRVLRSKSLKKRVQAPAVAIEIKQE